MEGGKGGKPMGVGDGQDKRCNLLGGGAAERKAEGPGWQHTKGERQTLECVLRRRS